MDASDRTFECDDEDGGFGDYNKPPSQLARNNDYHAKVAPEIRVSKLAGTLGDVGGSGNKGKGLP